MNDDRMTENSSLVQEKARLPDLITDRLDLIVEFDGQRIQIKKKSYIPKAIVSIDSLQRLDLPQSPLEAL